MVLNKKFEFFKKQDVKLFFILFFIVILIYGEKLFFYSLATDDFNRFYSHGGEQASWLGRWMAGVLNQNVFTYSIHILPYFHTLVGIFSFLLSGFLTAKYLKINNNFYISIISLLIGVSPFVAHNLYFNTNISVWITTLFGIFGFILLSDNKNNILLRIFGFILLVVAIGTYQTIIQVVISIIIIKTILDILNISSKDELKRIIRNFLFLLSIVVFSFFVSIFINDIYIEYNNLHIADRYKKSKEIVNIYIYIERILKMYYKSIYDTSFGLKYFQDKFIVIYRFTFIISLLLSILFIFFKKNIDSKLKIILILFLIALFTIIPIIINLPFITGNGIPTRAYYVVTWFIAGFFSILFITLKKEILKFFVYCLFISVFILSIYYINVFFNAAHRQTSSDIMRINQIVNRIRMNKNYIKEPIKFKIIGVKNFNVIGWRSNQQVLGRTVAVGYNSFKYFTDLKFSKMNDKEYLQLINYIINNNISIDNYPAKNSIIVYNNKALLVLNRKMINKDINSILIKKFLSKKIDKQEPFFKNKLFKLYLDNKDFFYMKENCVEKDVKHKFFLHVYPLNKTELLNTKYYKYGFENMDFYFKNKGKKLNNRCIIHVKLPNYEIEKIRTGQFKGNKRDWDSGFLYIKEK